IVNNGSYDPATGVWTIGDLASGANAYMSLIATVVGTPDLALTTSISATGDLYDPYPGNNSASSIITFGLADLSLSMHALNNSPSEGNTVTYTIVVSNGNVGGTATNVRVTVPYLDSGLNVTSVNPTSYNYNSYTWTLSSLAKNTSVTLTITGYVKSGLNGTLV